MKRSNTVSSIIIVVVLVVVAFIIALMNGKKRQEVTFENIRIVRGTMDAFDEDAWAWPEGTGEVVELHPLDTLLDGMLKVVQIKGNTIKFESAVPVVIEGEEVLRFELARFENLVIEPVDDEAEPIILSYEKMLDVREKEMTRSEMRAQTIEKIFAGVEKPENAPDVASEEASSAATTASEQRDATPASDK